MAAVKLPPTYTELPAMAMARTSLLIPEPSADHESAVNRAIEFAGTPSAVAKAPPA